jgi:threonine/homoserine/homoserine lactone efflux protein
MIPPVHLLPFLAVAVVVVITPGADMALVTKNALLHGRRPALATAVGINLGILFWTAAAALGLAALIAASQTAFTAIKLAGAAYLIFLGLQALRASRADQRANLPASVGAPISGRVALRQGLVSNLLNPKIAIFFTSLLPQSLAPTAKRLSTCCSLERSSMRWASRGSSLTPSSQLAGEMFLRDHASSGSSTVSAASSSSQSAPGWPSSTVSKEPTSARFADRSRGHRCLPG